MKPWRAFTLVWDYVASAFKSTELVYVQCVSKENFAVTVKGFTCVSLVCREIHISYVESIDERRRALVRVVVVNSPTDELFAGVRSPVLIRISYNRYILRSSEGFLIFLLTFLVRFLAGLFRVVPFAA